MKIIKRYIKENKRFILIFTGCIVIFAVTFFLYSLPLEAVLYPALLSLVFLLVAGAVGIKSEKDRHDVMEDANRRGVYLDFSALPSDTLIEEDYRRIVELLLEERADNVSEMNAKYQNLTQYYTLWAHQIKTPIASMRLKLSGEDSTLARELTADLFRIEQYVDMVMTYVRLGSDSTDYTFRDCSLDMLIKNSVKKFSSDFIRKRLSFEFEPQGLSVLTDEKWVAFVLEQLLSNALKYTQKGSIRIETGVMPAEKNGNDTERQDDGESGSAVYLSVTDTGIGISPENLPRIFEIGFTGINGRMEDNRASGIGLYLVKRICNNLKIEIGAESEVGKGTCIKLVFADRKVSLLQN